MKNIKFYYKSTKPKFVHYFFFRNRQPLDFFQALKRTVQIGLLAVPNRSGKVSPLFEKYLIIYISSTSVSVPTIVKSSPLSQPIQVKEKARAAPPLSITGFQDRFRSQAEEISFFDLLCRSNREGKA